jgi:eukaryotic-like serine/threonine-protein kinase
MRSIIFCLALMFVLLLGQSINAARPNAEETQIRAETPPTADSVSLAISPDGKKIVFPAGSESNYRLWLHSLDSGEAHPLPGTEGIAIPFSTCWSPDGRSIAFFSHGLMRLDIDTGLVRNLTQAGLMGYDIPEGRGCTWNSGGVILFSMAYSEKAIYQISAFGGNLSLATPPSRFELMYPHFLPDGIHFLYYAQGGGGVFVGQLGGGQAKKLLDADTAAVYSQTGHLLFVRARQLYAQKFDPASLTLSGDPFVVADSVPEIMSTAAVTTSAAGLIAYRVGGSGSLRQFAWFDRKGKITETVGEPIPLGVAAPDLSPDNSTVVFDGNQNGNMDVWILELKTGKVKRYTSDPANEFFPIWSADGKTIYFTSGRTGLNELYQKPADGSKPEQLVLNDRGQRCVRSVSRDGKYLLIALINALTMNLKADPPYETGFAQNCVHPQFSPDGKWIAYQTYPAPEVYIQHFPAGRRFQISTNGGGHVRWRADGKELFYMDLAGNLMAVTIKLEENGEGMSLGKPEALFKPPTIADIVLSPFAQQYNVSPDGQRFLIATVPKMKARVTVIRDLKPKR